MPRRTDPYNALNFRVEIDSIVVGGFASVSGLDVEMHPETYDEGGLNTTPHQLPGRFEYSNLVLERGVTDYQGFWQWLEGVRDAGQSGVDRRNVSVYLLDASGRQAWGWEVQRAYPVKWTGPSLDADSGAVAIETVELVHEGVTKVSGLPR